MSQYYYMIFFLSCVCLDNNYSLPSGPLPTTNVSMPYTQQPINPIVHEQQQQQQQSEQQLISFD